jgi:hypothetical protein
LPEIVQEIGAAAGLAAVVGLAVLSALYFSQARDVKRLREWAGRAPERAETPLPGRVVATPQAPQPVPTPPQAAPAAAKGPPAVPGRPAVPAAAAAAGAGPATATQGAPAAAGAAAAAGPATAAGNAAQATGAKATTPEAPAKPDEQPATEGGKPATEGGKPADEDTKPPDGATKPGDGVTKTAGEDAKPANGANSPGGQAAPPATAASAAAATASPPAAPPVPADSARAPSTPAGRVPSRAVPPPTPSPRAPLRPAAGSRQAPQSTQILRPPAEPWYRRIGTRYVALVLVGLVVIGGAAAYGVSQLTGGDGGNASNDTALGGQSDSGGTTKPKQKAAVNPASVTVAVLNGTTVPGLAATLSDQIGAAGFKIGTITNFSPNQQLAESVVQYAPGHGAEAKAVGRRIGVNQREPISQSSLALAGDAAVIVIAGADKAP